MKDGEHPTVQRQLMLPQVSVVLPCRDGVAWLAESLGSLRRQQGVELELVVVDDGSSDGSQELVRRLWHGAAGPLRLLQAGGLGVSAARNLGWRAARHPLVAFLDADDLALPGRLQRQAEMLQADPALQQVLCGWRRIDPGGRPLVDVRPWEEGAGFSTTEALRHKAVLPSAWMLRRQALEAVGGFEAGLSQAEDVDLLLRLASRGARGAWLEEVLCGYRVHAAAASRQALPQVRGLSYVVERHLGGLSASAEHQRLAAEVRYGTRAWLGWYAWTCGDQPLALELWTTALGLSPFPPGLTWVHLAENVVRSAARIGAPSQLESLLASPLWRELERRWWRSRHQPLLWVPATAPAALDWQAVHRGQAGSALLAWSRQFRAELQLAPGTEAASPMADWRPQAMARWCLPQGPLGELRQAVLRWSEALLALQPEQAAKGGAGPEPLEVRLLTLQRHLARILLWWAALCWQEDRRPTHQRLEQSVAVLPTPAALRALARLQRTRSTAGSQALLQLAALADAGGGTQMSSADPAAGAPAGSAAGSPAQINSGTAAAVGLKEESHLDQAPWEQAYWEEPAAAADQCNGPQCPGCIAQHLSGWTTAARPDHLVEWLPPAQSAAPLAAQAAERRLAVLEQGQAWLRPPAGNAWTSTHGFSVADRDGVPLASFSRRYPQPWFGACPFPQPAPQPLPAHGEPKRIDATVLALVGLSAETYYHWLLETLPSLGWLATHHPEWLGPELRIWHNGGSAPYVQDTLQRCCGIRPEQLLDARELPWIRARRLLALTPAPFASPSAAAQAWLRRSLLPPAAAAARQGPSRAIWLRRGGAARRPVFGEEQALEQLRGDGVVSVDCGGLSVPQQAQLLAGAALVIAPHGGAMANLVFAAAGTTVLELHHPDYRPPYYQDLVTARELRYFSQAQPATPPALYRDLLFESPATEPITLDVPRVVAAVRGLIGGAAPTGARST